METRWQRLTGTIWHRWLKRPYRLAKITDTAKGDPVILLHGLGRSAVVWDYTVGLLQPHDVRVVTFDLLGFGKSPKPDWLHYNVDDHAQALIASIEKLRLRQPAVLVGHSMGCLIAVRLASLRPDLVKHLVLYEMPLYSGLPDTRRYRLRLNLYFKIYEKIISYKPIFSGPGKKRAQRFAEKIAGFTLSDETWRPFVRSLRQTIMKQTTADDIKRLEMPMDVIYGSRDRLVIRGKTKVIFGEDAVNVTAHTIRESHGISRQAGNFIAERIVAAVNGTATQTAVEAKAVPASKPAKPARPGRRARQL